MSDRSAVLSDQMLAQWTDAFFAALGRGPCEQLREARMARVHALNHCSEEDLRAIGVSRELIPVFVFADLFMAGGRLSRS